MVKTIALAAVTAISAQYTPLKAVEPQLIGVMRISHYCTCPICCGPYSGLNKTASGRTPEPGVTVAAGPGLEFGEEIVIDGKLYRVDDRGGAIGNNCIDILCSTHEEALSKGVYYTEVYRK